MFLAAEVCRQFVRRSERLPIRPVRVGEWWDAQSANQIDIAALDADGRLFAAECKLGAVTREDLTALRRRAALLQSELGGASALYLAFFSARDQADDTIRAAIAAGEVQWFTLQDL